MHKLIDAIKKAQQYAKAIVAGVGSILVALTGAGDELGIVLVPAEIQGAVVFALAALTAFSTWAIPNLTPDGE
jgi:hypothetical protein